MVKLLLILLCSCWLISCSSVVDSAISAERIKYEKAQQQRAIAAQATKELDQNTQ